jgi:acetolactate synthase-1/2/3 large subunit
MSYTASTAFLEALGETGVSYIFANFGSDHPALVEAIAEARAHGRKIPTIITSPYEMVALTCAEGYAQLTGQAQAVIVHVDAGTQSLGGAVHNIARARTPALIFAGLSPYTQEGELPGSRNEFIMWIQDTADQRGIVRQYMKYDNELRTGRNVKQIVHRAMQIAHSDPKGPVYLVGAREVMEETVEPMTLDPALWTPLPPAPLPDHGVETIVKALAGARRPLIVTSYVGRRPEAVGELQRFCHRLGIGVLESVPSRMNFPHNDELYQGSHWNHPFQNQTLAEADAILVIDSDVPWIQTNSRPSAGAAIYHIDVDALKASMPLWYINARGTFQADATVALRQLNAYLDGLPLDTAAIEERRRHYADHHRRRQAELDRDGQPKDGVISAEFVSATVRRHLGDDAIVLNEGITNYPAVANHIAPTRPGSMFASGAGSLGWNGGAAIGMKLAAPEKTIVSITGDGSYMFSIPSTVHWMARQYETPFLHVVLNNRGWNAPKYSALAVHPKGYASRANSIDVAFDPPPDYSAIAAAAGGAYARAVTRPEDVEPAVVEALRIVREEKRSAVLDMWLPHL